MTDDSGDASDGGGLPKGGRGSWDGLAVVFATDPGECGAFFAELSEVVRRSRRTVLIRLSRPARRLGGPVVAVHLRRDRDPRFSLGPGLWLGPLRGKADQLVMCQWLRRGGPLAEALPEQLRSRVLCQPVAPIMAAQTSN